MSTMNPPSKLIGRTSIGMACLEILCALKHLGLLLVVGLGEVSILGKIYGVAIPIILPFILAFVLLGAGIQDLRKASTARSLALIYAYGQFCLVVFAAGYAGLTASFNLVDNVCVGLYLVGPLSVIYAIILIAYYSRWKGVPMGGAVGTPPV